MIEKLLTNETIDTFGRKYNATTDQIPVAAQPIGNGLVAIMLKGGGHFILPIPKAPNSVLSGCSVAVAGSVVTVAPGSWIISAAEYAKATNTLLGLSPLLNQAYQRIDLVLANSNNTFEILEGVEAANAVKPNVPVNKLEVGFILVDGTGAVIEQPAGAKNLAELGDTYIPTEPSSDLIILGWNAQIKKWVAKINAAGGKGMFEPVQDLAALKGKDTTDANGWPDKWIIVVESLNAIFRLDRESAAAGDDVNVVAPTTGVGRWHKTGGASDPTMGGEASGTASNATLSNSAVIAKVLTGLAAVAGSLLATDSIVLAFSKVKHFIDTIADTVRGVVLTGFDANLPGTVSATDNVVTAASKLQRQASANAAAIATLTVKTITAHYTLTQADNGCLLKVDTTTNVTITLPNGLTTGFHCDVARWNTGTVTFSSLGTYQGRGFTLPSRYSASTLVHEGSNVWSNYGDTV